MKNPFCLLFQMKTVSFGIVLALFVLSFVSCSKDDNDPEVLTIDPHQREGIINLYASGEKLVFPEVVEYPFVKISETGSGYDTIGFAYTGYIDKSRSSIGSVHVIILYDNLELESIEYRYPLGDNVAVSYTRSSRDFNTVADPFLSKIEERDDFIIGSLKGNLYIGGANFGKEPFVIDSCFFDIRK